MIQADASVQSTAIFNVYSRPNVGAERNNPGGERNLRQKDNKLLRAKRGGRQDGQKV